MSTSQATLAWHREAQEEASGILQHSSIAAMPARLSQWTDDPAQRTQAMFRADLLHSAISSPNWRRRMIVTRRLVVGLCLGFGLAVMGAMAQEKAASSRTLVRA